MQIHTFTVGPFAENTYLLTEQEEGLLIDPGFSKESEFQTFRKKLTENKAELVAIVLTHAHVDHVLGLQTVLDYFDVPVFLSDKDRYLWQNYATQAQAFGFRAEAFEFEPEPLPVKKQWELSSFTFQTLYTPGHAPDHVVLYNRDNNLLIAGDTLFREGIGRTDLYKGNFEQLEKSIKEKLFPLPADTTVYPGHGSSTTIGHEKQANPFING